MHSRRSRLGAASLTALAALSLPSVASAAPGELTPIAVDTVGNEYGYWEYLPEAYDETQDWPLLIFLSGIGEFGTGELPPSGDCARGPNYAEPVLCRNLRHGPQNLIYRQEVLGQRNLWDDEARPFIVISPQNLAPLFTYVPYNVRMMSEFLDFLVDRYAVDERRIYLTGMSMGGYSTTLIAANRPELFAAFAVMPGINGVNAASVCDLSQQNMWIFHGQNDRDPFELLPMVNLYTGFEGCPGPHPNARMTVYAGAGHDVWTRTIDPRLGMDDPVLPSIVNRGQTVPLDAYDIDLYSWLLLHDRPDTDAGPDFEVELGSGSFSLPATTLDDDAIDYAWTQTAGAPVVLQNAGAQLATVTGFGLGTYEFQVQAVDADGQWDVDSVVVTVVEGDGGEEGDSTGALEGTTGEGTTGEGTTGEGTTGDGTTGDGTTGDGTTGGASTGEVSADEGDSGPVGSDPLDVLDDTFASGDLSAWEVHNPQDVTMSAAPGEMILEPAGRTLWYQGREASHVFKRVTGDFAVTARLRVTTLAGGAPNAQYRHGGIMIRDASPSPGVRTYHASFGSLSTNGEGVVALMESTVNSDSTIVSQAYPSATGEIRLCRAAGEVVSAYRPDASAPWTVLDERTRVDLPAELAVGPVTYNLSAAGNLRTAVDYVDFASIDSIEDCLAVAPATANLLGSGDEALTEAVLEEGCACSAGSGGRGMAPAALALVVLLGLRRRRRA